MRKAWRPDWERRSADILLVAMLRLVKLVKKEMKE